MSRLFLLPALLCATFLRADDVPPGPDGKPVFGHSTHGDAFDEGPRQAAVLLEGMGRVDFPITTTNAEAQKFFNQGVAQLHGFWYYEAERSFRQAAMFDATSPMPYWGMAMSNINNDKRASEFIKEAVKRKTKASPREALYVEALSAYYSGVSEKTKTPRQRPGQATAPADGDKTKNDKSARRTALVKALEKIVFEFPDDLEAKAFLMFHVWDNAQKGIPISSKTALAALGDQVLAKNPMDPGVHHYTIHLWNHEDDRRALKSAALGGQSAPGVAHLWHMPGHTFTKLRRYADAAWQQEAAARTDHAYMISSKLLPEQIHNYAHNNDWLVENLGFIGRVNDAVDLAKNMIELPRPAPGHKLVGKDGYRDARGGYQMGQKRLVDALLAWERWDDLLALDGSAYLPAATDPIGEAKRLLTLGIAAFQKNDKPRGNAKLEALRKLIADTKQERTTKADTAESEAKTAKKPADQIAKAIADALLPFIQRSEEIEKLVSELEIDRALAEGRKDDARKALDKLTNPAKVRLSQLHQQAGNDVKALQLARDAVNGAQDQVLPLANLTDILWQGGKKKEALDTFKKLRPLCAQADIDQPVFTRLQPVIDELKLPADWRPKLEWAKDTGVRPDLASLGPFRWHPYPASDWSLPDQNEKTRLFREFQGKPLIMIFYLGSGCSHCIEQLNAFGPMTKEFEAAGIKLVAVSTEKAAELHKTFAQAKGEAGFPFPIVADETLATFKAYRAFDDFERMPLHGTFLIDANGLVRWQDISFKPFSDAKWLLAEAKRLLALPPQATEKALTSTTTGGKESGSN